MPVQNGLPIGTLNRYTRISVEGKRSAQQIPNEAVNVN
jgi:hypothetical protein